MKTILFLACGMAALLSACEKPDKLPESELSETELQTPISDAVRLDFIEDWQEFQKNAGASMLLATEKLEKLEKQLYDGQTREQVKKRRIYNACSYRLEKLQTKRLKQGIKFRNKIDHYTVADRIKNESFRASFNAKLNQIHNELDQCLQNQP